MLRRSGPVTAWLALPLLLTFVAGARAQSRALNPDDFVVREHDALLLDTPKLVTAGAVVQALWSSSGKHVLAFRAETDLATVLAGRPKHETTLVLWTRETLRQQVIWKSNNLDTGVDQVEWIQNSDSALAVVRRPAPAVKGMPPQPSPVIERWLILINARGGVMRPLMRLPERALVMASPRRPLAVVQSTSPRLLAVVRADGMIRDLSSPALKLPTGYGRWTPDGNALRFSGPKPPEGQSKGRPPVFLLDPETVKLTGPLTSEQYRGIDSNSQARVEAPALEVKHPALVIHQGESSREVRPLWLESSAPGVQRRALVSAHAREGHLSPTGDAILYVDEGGAWVRLLHPVARAVFQVAWDRVQREKNLHRAKQLGVGFMLFAQDNEETLPAGGSDLQLALSPYAKQPGFLDGFVYIFPGGKLRDIPEPAATQLGYIPAPGGRVVLFVDGHVKFMPE